MYDRMSPSLKGENCQSQQHRIEQEDNMLSEINQSQKDIYSAGWFHHL